MAPRKTEQEKMADLDKKIAQLQNQKKALKAKASADARKKRTRRLIQIGALSEKFFNRPDIEPEDFEKFLEQIMAIDAVKALVAPPSPSEDLPAEPSEDLSE